MQKYPLDKKGFSLMETLVSLFIIMILIVGLYSLIQLSLQITGDNKNYVQANNIANQKMEYVRNLPYNDVGTASGSPAGILPDYEILDRNGIFNVHTTVMFYDDPYDGLESGGDTVFIDYKIVTIEVSWTGRFNDKSVTVFSKVIPNTEETWAGYGLIKLIIVDSGGSPVPLADIHIENTGLGLSVDLNADTSGGLSYPVLPDIESYEVTVSLPGYGTDATHDRDAVNPEPTKPHLSVFEGLKTEESFSIDHLAALQIKTVGNTLPNNWQINESRNNRDSTKAEFDIDGADNMYFAWQSENSTSSYIYIQKFNTAQTAQWSPEIQISTSQFQYSPDIAVDGSGNSFVVWHDNSTSLKTLYTRGSPSSRLAKASNKKNNYKFGLYSPDIVRSYFPSFSTADILNKFSFSPSSIGSINLSKNWHDIFTIPYAQAAGAIVQSKIGSVYDNSTTMTATFDSPPTNGNVIIALAMHRNSNTTFNAPTNSAGTFTVSAYSNSSWAMDVGIWHKVAGAGEPTQVTITSTHTVEGGALMLLEVSGLDTSDLIDVTATNDQTGSSGNTATTGNTPLSEAGGFAIACSGFADNNFTTPNSANWSSASSDAWSHRLWRDWGGWGVSDGSFAVATMDISAASLQSATLTLSGGGGEERNSAMAVFRTAIPDSVTVSATGTQDSSVVAATADIYLGGKFVISDNTGAHQLSRVIISESGTINALDDLSNIKLYYDLDSSSPYDCAGEVLDTLSDPLFGIATTSFSAADGLAIFDAGSAVNINTSQSLCLYVVTDIDSSAAKGDTINFRINDPPNDITVDSGLILPYAVVEIDSYTTIDTPALLEQSHFRWRNDDNDEIAATWLEFEDFATTLYKNDLVRLRFAFNNAGSLDSVPTTYRIEYGELLTDCSDIAVWTALPNDNSQHWRVIDSSEFFDADPTTNVPGGLSDGAGSFTPGEIKDTSNITGAIILAGDDYTEIEYAIQATASANDSNYCFRLTNAGSTANFSYVEYPRVAIIGDNNIFIKSYNSSGAVRWAARRVNADVASESQINPAIGLADNFGLATSVVAWEDDRNGNSDIYAQSFDTNGTRLWGADLQVTSSSTDEHSAKIIIDAADNIYFAWVDSSATGDNIYWQKYDLSGSSLWPAAHAVAASIEDEYAPALTSDSSNNTYLTWTEDNATILNIYLAKYDSAGIEQWRISPNLGSATEDQYDPSVALNNGDLFVSWTDNREGNDDIYAQMFDLSGTAQWAEDVKINVNTGASLQTHSSLIANSLSDPYGVWQDQRDSDEKIFAAKFFDPLALVAIPNVPFTLTGTKQIGDNPIIYEHNAYYTTDGSGEIVVPVEWDIPGYSLTLNPASTSLNIISQDPIQPNQILAGELETWIIYLE